MRLFAAMQQLSKQMRASFGFWLQEMISYAKRFIAIYKIFNRPSRIVRNHKYSRLLPLKIIASGRHKTALPNGMRKGRVMGSSVRDHRSRVERIRQSAQNAERNGPEEGSRLARKGCT